MENYQEFKDSIEILIEDKRQIMLSCIGIERSAIVLAEIFKNSTSKLLIFFSDLESNVYDDKSYLEELQQCIQRFRKNIFILFVSEPLPNSNIAELLKANKIKTQKIFNTEQFYKEFKNRPANFTIADNSMFHMVINHNNNEALFSFNSSAKCEKLEDIFFQYYQQEVEHCQT